ncbi:hypothetical protein BGZ76_009615 [Entomortierella beljakovae]|nr:hypothetical protein BGZ76_009615 [Entomortierella beljakovae]
MSCDLTDPAILDAYNAIVGGTPINWLILGYHDTRDKISLYSSGTGGLEELRSSLTEEVLYGFVRVEDRYALLSYVSEQVSGLRRARALVHGKAVGALFKNNHVQITSSSIADLADDKVRARLGLADGLPTPDRSNSPVMPSSPVPAPRPVTPISPSSPANSLNNNNTKINTNTNTVNSPEVPSSPLRTASPALSNPRSERQLEIEAAERKAREDMERQKRSEIAKRQKETQEREAREQELLAQKQTQELERKRKEESDKLAREAMKKKLIEMEKLRGSGLTGYIAIQPSGSPFWRRRFYVMRGQVIYFYRDEFDRVPVSEMKLGGRIVNIEDASLDCIIPNSFKVDLYTGESHLFYSDSLRDKEFAIAGFMKCSESA